MKAPHPRSRHGAALTFALALAVRLAVVAWAASRIPPTADGAFYDTIARRIADGLGYTWLWPDGAVTYAGHYPIGYPAIVALAYAIGGARPVAAMAANALIGAFAAAAAYRLAEGAGGRRCAAAAGPLAALHPGLVAYTPALMTEGVTASLLICAAWAAERSARTTTRAWLAPLLAGALLGAATLVRPQSLLLAPLFGLLAAHSAPTAARPLLRRAAYAALALATALAVCAPWTARNCARMSRCALVSYNGGWNLLIGADEASTGTWSEIKVPPECREVYDEAEKDVCFGGAARRFIAEHPTAWLALAPKKLAATFDYAGAGPWYLHAANPAAFPETAKKALGAIETVYQRLLLILAVVACARRPAALLYHARPKTRAWRPALVCAASLLTIAGCFLRAAWIPHLLLIPILLAAAAPADTPDRPPGAPRPILLPATAIVVLSLIVTHAVFFGAGRYSLAEFPFIAAVAALAFARAPRARSAETPSDRAPPPAAASRGF